MGPETRTGAHPHIPAVDVGGTPSQMGASHGEAQRDRIRAFADELIGYLRPYRHRNGNGHAAFSGGSECRANQRVDGLVEVSIGQNNQMILSAA